MQKQETITALTQGENANAEPLMLTKRIGSTNYQVSVHFSQTSDETLEDKLVLLLEREVNKVA